MDYPQSVEEARKHAKNLFKGMQRNDVDGAKLSLAQEIFAQQWGCDWNTLMSRIKKAEPKIVIEWRKADVAHTLPGVSDEDIERVMGVVANSPGFGLSVRINSQKTFANELHRATVKLGIDKEPVRDPSHVSPRLARAFRAEIANEAHGGDSPTTLRSTYDSIQQGLLEAMGFSEKDEQEIVAEITAFMGLHGEDSPAAAYLNIHGPIFAAYYHAYGFNVVEAGGDGTPLFKRGNSPHNEDGVVKKSEGLIPEEMETLAKEACCHYAVRNGGTFGGVFYDPDAEGAYEFIEEEI